ncbi:hypothetical protein FQN49_007341 [Arthroderma sp. PD_2]|nr:hypothetical protein FQN49_007341 [Arthroderma sp. PD_2]
MLSKEPEPICQEDGAGAAARPAELSTNDRFFRYFQEEVAKLQEKISCLPTTPTIGGEQVDAADYCLAGISRLSDEVKDASSYIPSYDQRVYSESIKALQEKLAETKAAIAPRKKFAFKRSRHTTPVRGSPGATDVTTQSPKLGATDDNNNLDSPRDSMMPESQSTPKEPSIVSFDYIREAHVVIPASAPLKNSSAAVTNVNNCVVDMYSPPEIGRTFANFTVQNVSESLLICGKVDGAIHATDIFDSMLVVSCQQFRMHGCSNVDVYLSCASKPIIEDCVDIRFTPLPNSYAAQNGKKTDMWSLVEDFKWLKAEQSPNWSILDPSSVVPEEVWEYLSTNRETRSLDEIFKATGLNFSQCIAPTGAFEDTV